MGAREGEPPYGPPGFGRGQAVSQGRLYFSPIAKLPGMGEYNTREAKVEQEASLSEIESLTQVEATETEATEARQHIKATRRKQTPHWTPVAVLLRPGFFIRSGSMVNAGQHRGLRLMLSSRAWGRSFANCEDFASRSIKIAALYAPFTFCLPDSSC